MKKNILFFLWPVLFSGCYPKHEEDFYNAGNEAFIEENYFTAIENMNLAVELKPDFSSAYFVRANAYNNIGDFHKALQDYDNAIKYNPKFAVAYRLRGVVKITTGDTINALHDWRSALKLGDNRAGHYLLLYDKISK